jgi:hypothetical protein
MTVGTQQLSIQINPIKQTDDDEKKEENTSLP